MAEQINENEQLVRRFEEELKTLLSRYGLEMSADIAFPQYAVLPDEVKLAQLVFNRHGAVIRTRYILKGEKNNANQI